MAEIKRKILIIEDDKRFAESLVRILEHEGYSCHHTHQPKEGLSLAQVEDFDAVLVDCLLPGQNGVDLVLKLKDCMSPDTPFFIMSGVYKDRNFSINTIKKTGAKSFFMKPIEPDHLLEQLKSSLPTEEIISEEARASVSLDFLSSETPDELKSALRDIKAHSFFMVPLLLEKFKKFSPSHTLTAEAGTGGYQIEKTDNGINIYLQSDVPVQPFRKDLLTNNWVIEEDFIKVSAKHNLTDLIDESQISPHFAERILKQRFKVNLFSDTQLTVSELNKKCLHLIQYSTNEYENLIDELISEIKDKNIIQSFLGRYQENYIETTGKEHRATKNSRLIFENASLNSSIKTPPVTLNDVIESEPQNELQAFLVFYLLLLHDEVRIQKQVASKSSKKLMNRILRLKQTMSKQGHFERLRVTSRASDEKIKSSYNSLARQFHPDKFINEPNDLKLLAEQVFQMITESFNQIRSFEKRKSYMDELKNKESEKTSQADSLCNKAFQALSTGNFSQAAVFLEKSVALVETDKALILSAWVDLKSGKSAITSAAKKLIRVSNTSKESVLFYHVKGIHFSKERNYDKAKVMFKKALAKDNGFISARRELTLVEKELEKIKPKSFLQSDLKDVVGMFFKKKK